MKHNFVGLIILDGFGLREEREGNAILQANPINFFNYFNNYPSSYLDASGEAVGLLAGTMGNSETGHLNIGAGKVVEQKLRIIDKSLKTKGFYNNAEIVNTCEHVKKHKSNLHIMGLLSDGKVHSDIIHLFELIDVAVEKNVKNIYIHCFLDGRDTYRDSGIKYMQSLIDKLADEKYSNVKIASMMGRYYAMDREENYDRIEKAYRCMVFGESDNVSTDPISSLKNSYEKEVFDEYVEPTNFEIDNGTCSINDYDGIFFFNFRDDRARQITKTFIVNEFDKFKTKDLSNIYFCGFSQYDDTYKNLHYAFCDQELTNNLSKVISESGLKQLKVAETTKYAHVTFYLNGGTEDPYKNEDRVLIPSIKCKSFDEYPEMRTVEITESAINKILTKEYSFMALNYSNCDMLGHTGNMDATIKSIKLLDVQLKKLVDAIISIGGVAVITADHGNAEKMLDENGKMLTEHTTSKVPFIVVNCKENIQLANGKLANIAPTVLDLLGLSIPNDFEELSLIKK